MFRPPPSLSTTIDALSARVDLLNIVVQELARSLSPAQAAQVSAAVRARAATIASAELGEAVDEGLSADLVPLLDALAVVAPILPAH